MAYNSTTWSQDSKTKGTNDVTTDVNKTITGTLTADKIKLSGNIIQASDGGTSITLDTSDNIIIGGDLTVTGNDIKSSSATAITLSGANSTIAGDLNVTGDLTVTGNDIKSSSATAITLSGANTSLLGTLDVASTINLGANSYMTLDQNSITVSSGNLTIDTDGDLTLEADGDNIHFTVSGTEVMELDANSRVSCSNADAGSNNTLFGFQAGVQIASGDNYNTFIGYAVADADMTNATYNTGLGYLSLSALTEGDGNLAVGSLSGSGITTGPYNTLIGHGSGRYVATGARNVALGSSALGTADGAEGRNIAIGYAALNQLNSPSGTSLHNTAIGYYALYSFQDKSGSGASYNTAIGSNAVDSLTTGYQNVMVGANSLTAADGSENQNTGIGHNVMSSVNHDSSIGNVAIGYTSLTGGATEIAYNVAIGYATMYSSNTNTNCIAIGKEAGKSLTGSIDNIAIGTQSQYYANTADADNNISIGNQAMYGVSGTAMEGAENICIGKQAGYILQGDAGYNTIIGHNAGNTMTTGDYNVVLGRSAGTEITTANNNICIGASADVNGAGVAGAIAIGRYAKADDDYEVRVGHYGAISWRARRMFITAANSGDNKVIAEVFKIPARSIIKSVTCTVVTKSGDLSTYALNLSLSTSTGTSAGGDLYNASTTITNPEILGAGANNTYQQNSAIAMAGTAADIVAGTGGNNGTTYTNYPNTTVVGTADTYLYVCNAGTGNGASASSANVQLNIVVEFYGKD